MVTEDLTLGPEGPEDDEQTKVLKRWDGLVWYLIKRHFRWALRERAEDRPFCPTSSYGLEDLVQVGRIGLLAAHRNFQPESGVSFKTFAYRVVKNHMLKFLRESVREVGLQERCGVLPPVLFSHLEQMGVPVKDISLTRRPKRRGLPAERDTQPDTDQVDRRDYEEWFLSVVRGVLDRDEYEFLMDTMATSRKAAGRKRGIDDRRARAWLEGIIGRVRDEFERNKQAGDD